MPNLKPIHDHVVSMLHAGLSAKFTYHNVGHTLDVFEQCLAIATEEGITDPQILFELQVAALYHDTGFLFVYNNHEERSCIIAREQLPGFGINAASIETICEIIMATKVPQTPLNHLQQIICDADLDYLGRPDFFDTGNSLRKELIAFDFINDQHDWDDRQLQFLKSHHYFTATSKRKRAPQEQQFIEQLIRNNKTASK
jgi:predicted metal-dependent HD superfamily phosphohydrolase